MSQNFDRLKKIETKIDNLCLEKRLHTEAEHLKRIKCIKTLRFYFKMSLGEETFIRVDTRVINDFKNHETVKTSSLIKRLCVVFNSDLEPSLEHYRRQAGEEVESQGVNSEEVEIFEWNKTEEEVDAFELRSKSKPKNIKLLIDFENKRDLYKLSRVLREIVEKYTETKPNVITNLWKYIHKNGLIKPGEIEISADEKLKELSGKDRFLFTEIPEILVGHLCPIDSLVVEMPVKDFHKEIFDVPIEVDDLYHLPRVHSKDVYGYEKKVEMSLDFKRRLEEKRDVLSKFEKNPIEFINRWICLESTDYYTKTHFLLDSTVQELLYEMIQKLPYL